MPKKKPKPEPDYSNYVEHPRYGKGPRYTDLHPIGASYTWHTAPLLTSPGSLLHKCFLALKLTRDTSQPITGTAIKADPTKHKPGSYVVTYYCDIEKVCKGCGRRFIFFAEEQKHWYEELKFDLSARPVRCTDCRKKLHNTDRLHRRYQELSALPSLTTKETLELVECGVCLIEQSVYGDRALQKVRYHLKRIPEDQQNAKRVEELKERIRAVVDKRQTEARDLDSD